MKRSIDPHAFGLHKAAYSVLETMAILSIGRSSLYRIINDGRLPAVKFGKKTLFYASDIAAFLTHLKETGSDVHGHTKSGTGGEKLNA